MRRCIPVVSAPCLLLSLLLLAGSDVARGAQASPRGVAPEDRQYFSGKTVRCRDGSKEVPAERVNDDFCDCADGTDEPGTAACANGRFFCRNRGHKPATIFSSRVNDGICDCCDGSDEYGSRATCKNTCVEEGAASRRQLTDAVSTYKQGVKLREKFVASAKRKRDKWTAEIERSSSKIAALKEKEKVLAEEKAAVEKVEEEERERAEALRREEEERERAEQAKAAPAGGEEEGTPAAEETQPELSEEMSSGVDSSDAEEASVIEDATDLGAPEGGSAIEAEEPELPAVVEEPAPESGGSGEQESTEGLSKEELGALVASRWTGGGGAPEPPPPAEPAGPDREEDDGGEFGEGGEDGDDFEDEHDDAGEDFVTDSHMDAEDGGDEEYTYTPAAYAGEQHEHEHEHDDDDEDGEEAEGDAEGSTLDGGSPARVWWKQLVQWPRDVGSKLYSYISPTATPSPANATDAEQVRKDYSEVTEELRKLEARVSKLHKNLAADYGPDGEFIALADKCYSLTLNQYVYEICPYSKATQKEGHSTTRLGDWTGFKSEYTLLAFENGDHCWNGPARSMTVKLECGLKAEVRSVEEPSRCEYSAVLTTPAACSPQQAQDLEQELEEKTRELTNIGDHDEL